MEYLRSSRVGDEMVDSIRQNGSQIYFGYTDRGPHLEANSNIIRLPRTEDLEDNFGNVAHEIGHLQLVATGQQGRDYNLPREDFVIAMLEEESRVIAGSYLIHRTSMYANSPAIMEPYGLTEFRNTLPSGQITPGDFLDRAYNHVRPGVYAGTRTVNYPHVYGQEYDAVHPPVTVANAAALSAPVAGSSQTNVTPSQGSSSGNGNSRSANHHRRRNRR
ncbi:hypothetical protein [Micromonospora sp. NPDC047527]|uniref:hypothetical protein n=1 Tax=Micromonospora sp. NPDC047527 TaxID=3155144 RepID=UPI0033F024C4